MWQLSIGLSMTFSCLDRCEIFFLVFLDLSVVWITFHHVNATLFIYTTPFKHRLNTKCFTEQKQNLDKQPRQKDENKN